MSEGLPIIADKYFFTRQEIVAIPDHNPEKGPEIQTAISLDINFGQGAVGRTVSGVCLINSDDSTSINPHYSFRIESVGYFKVAKNVEIDDGMEQMCRVLITQFLVGVIRERLHEMTSRGPWGPLTLDLIPLKKSAKTEEKREEEQKN